MWGIHHRNSSLPLLCRLLQTSADCTGQRATEQNILLLAQSLQHVFSLHRNRKTSWKRPPGKSCKCLSKYCNQTRACPTQLCADILGLLLNEASREAPCLFEQHSTAQLFHVVCIQQWDQGKHQGSKKKEYFVSEKKKRHHIFGQQSGHELAKEAISLLQGALYLDDKLLWLNCFWLPPCVSAPCVFTLLHWWELGKGTITELLLHLQITMSRPYKGCTCFVWDENE